jgi:hypothetical protein
MARFAIYSSKVFEKGARKDSKGKERNREKLPFQAMAAASV